MEKIKERTADVASPMLNIREVVEVPTR